MTGKLEFIRDWECRARRAGYDLDRFARTCGVTERRLQQFFRQTRGVSPHHWLSCLRLSDGIIDLPDGCQVKEAADQLGYSRVATFFESFKAAFDLPPGRFFRHHRTREQRISFFSMSASFFRNSVSEKRKLYIFTTFGNSGIENTDTLTLTYENPIHPPPVRRNDRGDGPTDQAPNNRPRSP